MPSVCSPSGSPAAGTPSTRGTRRRMIHATGPGARGDNVTTERLHLVLHPVRADRAADFECFLSEVVGPAVRAQRPALDNRWRVLRSSEARDDIVTYALLFEGGSLADDWELDVLLPAHYGAEEAERMVGEWSETFASLRRWADTSVADGLETNQCLWTFDPVR
jgi:hypothetical protein